MKQMLTQELILREALALIDAVGLEQFSMRKLGARLGVEAMALYHHVAAKPAMLDAVAQHLLSEIVAPGEGVGWRAGLGQAARAWRAVAHAHPKAFPLMAARICDEYAAFFQSEQALLTAAGLEARDAARNVHILNAFAGGVVAGEIASAEAVAGAFERGLVMILDGIARAVQRARETPAER